MRFTERLEEHILEHGPKEAQAVIEFIRSAEKRILLPIKVVEAYADLLIECTKDKPSPLTVNACCCSLLLWAQEIGEVKQPVEKVVDQMKASSESPGDME